MRNKILSCTEPEACYAQTEERIVPETATELLIKKYGNRRLYDTEASRYITLDDLAKIVKGGRDVRVVDAKSGKDLTKGVLLQIITEREEDHDVLPVSFLKKMIQLSDQTVRDSLHRYLRVSLDAFLSAQKEFEERYKSFAGTFMNPMGAAINPMGWPMSFFGVPGAEPPPPAPPVDLPREPGTRRSEKAPPEKSPPGSADDQLRSLQAQMAEMQALIAKLAKK
jgi:polyhydroxyalkanoate synthesis repressor PhaR